MHARRVARSCVMASCLILCLVLPGLAGPPPGWLVSPTLGLGLGAAFGAAAAASVASEVGANRLRDRVAGLCSPQIREIDPDGQHFSLHDLGEYEACQTDLRALLAFEPVQSRPPAAPARGQAG